MPCTVSIHAAAVERLALEVRCRERSPNCFLILNLPVLVFACCYWAGWGKNSEVIFIAFLDLFRDFLLVLLGWGGCCFKLC